MAVDTRLRYVIIILLVIRRKAREWPAAWQRVMQRVTGWQWHSATPGEGGRSAHMRAWVVRDKQSAAWACGVAKAAGAIKRPTAQWVIVAAE